MKQTCSHHQTRTEVETFQTHALRKFLSNVVQPHSNYYKEIFDANRFEPKRVRSIKDLKHLPLSSKEDIAASKENPNAPREFVLNPNLSYLKRKPSIIAKTLIRGKAAVKSSLKHEFQPVMMTSTTGRSAEPTPFFYTHHDIANLRTGGKQLIDIGGAEEDDRILNMFPYAPHLAYWLVHYAALESNLFCVSTGGGKVMGTEGNIRMMQKIRPTILVGMPTFVYHVLHQAIESGITIPTLRRIVLGGEKVPSGTRRKLARMAADLGSHHATVTATYGFTEAKMAWGECPFNPGDESGGYHLFPDMGIMEIVDPKTGALMPDGEGGELVYTPLNARGTVVIRYRTGDFIENGLNWEPCPHCGRQMPRITGKISRVSNIRPMELHKLKGTLVDFNTIEHLLDNIEHIGTWQLELRKINDEPLELDEIILHANAVQGTDLDKLKETINQKLVSTAEIRPNKIIFHDSIEIQKLQNANGSLKEEKIIDNRAQANSSLGVTKGTQ